jgi:hypothetical protein
MKKIKDHFIDEIVEIALFARGKAVWLFLQSVIKKITMVCLLFSRARVSRERAARAARVKLELTS